MLGVRIGSRLVRTAGGVEMTRLVVGGAGLMVVMTRAPLLLILLGRLDWVVVAMAVVVVLVGVLMLVVA